MKTTDSHKYIFRCLTSLIIVCFLTAGITFTANAEKVTLQLSRIIGWQAKPLKEAAEAYSQLHPEIKVVVTDIPFAEWYERTVMQFIVGGGADVCFVPNIGMAGAEFPAAGWTLPLKDLIKEIGDPEWDINDFPKVVLDSYSYIPGMFRREPPFTLADYKKGDLYGLPYENDIYLLYYRKDLFEDPIEKANFRARYGYELKPPINWKQYRDISEFFTRKKGETLAGKVLDHNFYGCSAAAKKALGIADDYYMLMGAFGARITDENFRPTLNSPKNIKAVKYYVDLVTKYAPPGALSYDIWEVAISMQKGLVAMATTWNPYSYLMEAPDSKVKGKVGYAKIPEAPLLGGWGLVINAKTRHPKEAFKLAEFITNRENGIKLYKAGGASPRLSVIRDPEIRKLDPAIDAIEETMQGWMLPNGPHCPHMMEMEWIIINAISNAVTKQKTVEQALTDANKELGALLKKYKLIRE